MSASPPRSILMMSLHGYVGAEPELGRPDTGGQVVFVLELARHFHRLGCRVDVVTRRFEDQPAVDRIDRGLRVLRIPFGGDEFVRKEDMHEVLPEFVSRMVATAQRSKTRYDLVNSHYWDAGWAGQRVAEELRIPHVHTPHSLGEWKRRDMGAAGRKDQSEYRFAERIEKEYLICRACDHVVATTNQQLDLLRDFYRLPEDHVSVIPPGIDETRFTPAAPDRVDAARRELGLGPKSVYAVGRAAANKGYDLLLRSLPTLRKIVPGSRLHLAVGAGSRRDHNMIERWKALASELEIGSAVRWHGHVADERMADYYRAAGVFCLSSRYEPFGMTAVEAMACGTPVVLTPHGGLHEQTDFGAQALWADPKKPEELGAVLGLPLRYPALRERLSVEGARFARREFSWSGIARRSLRLFERFLGRYDDRSGLTGASPGSPRSRPRSEDAADSDELAGTTPHSTPDVVSPSLAPSSRGAIR